MKRSSLVICCLANRLKSSHSYKYYEETQLTSLSPTFFLSLQTPPRPADGTRSRECGGLLELPDNGRCVLQSALKGHVRPGQLYHCTIVPLSTCPRCTFCVPLSWQRADSALLSFNKMSGFLFCLLSTLRSRSTGAGIVKGSVLVLGEYAPTDWENFR